MKIKNKKILLISGFDPTAGAGILRDMSVLHEFGIWACGVVTANTVQSQIKGHSEICPVDSKFLAQQLQNLVHDEKFDCVKIGLVPNVRVAQVIAKHLKNFSGKIVWDPVFSPTRGRRFVSTNLAREISKTILPLCDVVTPNLLEFSEMTNCSGTESRERMRGCQQILKLGSKSILIKGGHDTQKICCDYFVVQNNKKILEREFFHPRRRLKDSRGTGCRLSSAISVHLVLKPSVFLAVQRSIEWLQTRL